MAKKKPELIMTIPVGGPFDKMEVEIWNDIQSVRTLGPNRVEFTRDNGWKSEVASGDAAGINKVYAVAVAVIAGRNYGA
jgi:hypothetical protein